MGTKNPQESYRLLVAYLSHIEVPFREETTDQGTPYIQGDLGALPFQLFFHPRVLAGEPGVRDLVVFQTTVRAPHDTTRAELHTIAVRGELPSPYGRITLSKDHALQVSHTFPLDPTRIDTVSDHLLALADSARHVAESMANRKQLSEAHS